MDAEKKGRWWEHDLMVARAVYIEVFGFEGWMDGLFLCTSTLQVRTRFFLSACDGLTD